MKSHTYQEIKAIAEKGSDSVVAAMSDEEMKSLAMEVVKIVLIRENTNSYGQFIPETALKSYAGAISFFQYEQNRAKLEMQNNSDIDDVNRGPVR